MLKQFISIVAGSTALIGFSNAAVLDFTAGGNVTPSSVTNPQVCSPNDICGTALNYASAGLVVTSAANGVATNATLQDLSPANGGLGVFSEGERNNDEINFATNESLILSFGSETVLTNISLNNDDHIDCPAIATEGGCGNIGIRVDGGSIQSFAAISVLTEVFTGNTFEIFALSEEGFYVGSVEVTQTPLPAAAFFMATGLAAFAHRRKKQAA